MFIDKYQRSFEILDDSPTQNLLPGTSIEKRLRVESGKGHHPRTTAAFWHLCCFIAYSRKNYDERVLFFLFIRVRNTAGCCWIRDCPPARRCRESRQHLICSILTTTVYLVPSMRRSYILQTGQYCCGVTADFGQPFVSSIVND